MKNIYKISIVLISLSIFNGCTTFYSDEVLVEAIEANTDNYKNITRSTIEERINENKYLSFNNARSLSNVLNALSLIDGRIYKLDNYSKDIILDSLPNSQRLKISSFKELKTYIEDTTDFTIDVSKNRFLKNKLTLVELYSKDNEYFKNIKFNIEGSVSIKDALLEITKNTGYNIIINDDFYQNDKDSKNSSLFDNKYIRMKGNNIIQLLDLISKHMNIYISVDHKNKYMILSKLQKRQFELYIPNINISANLDVEKSGSEAGDIKNAVKTKISLDILNELEKSVVAVLKTSYYRTYIDLSKTFGSLNVETDMNTMEAVAKIVNKFNEEYTKQIDIKMEIFEYVVSQDFQISTSFTGSLNTILGSNLNGNTASITGGIVSGTTNIQNVSGSGQATGMGTSTKNSVLVKYDQKQFTVKNNIPFFIDNSSSESYVSEMKTETTVTDGTAVKNISVTTDSIKVGSVLTIVCKIIDNKININIQPVMISKTGESEFTTPDVSTTLIDYTTETFKSDLLFYDNERKIITSTSSYIKSDNYNGMVPIDNFLIGGANGDTYFRKEMVYVLSAKIK